ncbi:MAG: T9SS type A sorting domain-containing protein [Bacteroidetes bacterium]|nr:T9SS type A sorting domain-containing protein [Bacteroidota bacterium]MBU1580428.1 T9SS type A sorting domain-containing protein [Bacteroidota bacterium]MBU2557838.1 T9SS type A sorting domain-containing protein [Bacteroidota bacterium]
MKRGFLPLSLLLTFTILAGTSLLASTPEKGGKYTPRNSEAPGAETYRTSLRANQHTGIVDPADVLKAMQQSNQQGTNKDRESLNWVNLGPDNFGGQVKAIIFDNRDAAAGTILIGATGGGIWKSVNNGITWHRVSQNNMMVSSMVQAPNGDIYVGTGDGFNAQDYNGLSDFEYTTGLIGQGVFKSTDGENFEQLPATIPAINDNTAAWAFVNELAINGAGDVFAATNAGLMFTTDGGLTWNVASDEEANELSMNATDVKIGSDGTIIAAVANKCYISKDGNTEAFVNRSTGDSISLPIDNVNRLELAIAPSDPNKIYASAVTSFGVHQGVYASSDKGDHWEVILPATNQNNIYNGFGNYNNSITVFPNNPDRILINGLLLWQGRKVVEQGLYSWDMKSNFGGSIFGDTYVHPGQHTLVFNPANENQIFIGSDGGIFKGAIAGEDFTFETSNRNFITSRYYTVAPSGQENRVVGGSQDNGTVYISSQGNTIKEGEVIYSPSFPTHGGTSVVSTINPQAAVVSSVAGSMQRTEDMGFTFSTQFLGPLMGNSQVFNTPIALWESYDNENSRDSVTFFAKKNYAAGDVLKVWSNNNDHPFYYTLPNALQTGDSVRVKDIVSTKLFIAVANRVWMTKDLLNFGLQPEWFELANTSVNFSGIPQSMAYSKDANHVFVGTRDGKLFRISNLALAHNYDLADVNSPECIVATSQLPIYEPGTTTPISQTITSIAVDPNNPNNVMVTLANYGNENYVFMTNNALDPEPTFTSKQGNLPLMPVYASIIEMSSPEKAMLGTEHGIYITEDINNASPVWVADQGEMGNVPVFDLKQQWINKSADTVQLINIDTLVIDYPGTNNYGIIYAASFGRGLYRCNNFRKPVGVEENPSLIANNELSMTIYPNPITDQATIKFEVTENNTVSYQLFDLSGRLVQKQELGIYTQGKHQVNVNLGQLQNGAYILKMQSGQKSKAHKILVY